jgi:hypothetical protein
MQRAVQVVADFHEPFLLAPLCVGAANSALAGGFQLVVEYLAKGETLCFHWGLTFDMSGPPPAWPAQRNMDRRSEAGRAGGGPLDGRVRPQHSECPDIQYTLNPLELNRVRSNVNFHKAGWNSWPFWAALPLGEV